MIRLRDEGVVCEMGEGMDALLYSQFVEVDCIRLEEQDAMEK